MPQPIIERVRYICDDNHSWLHRIYWDYWGCTKWLKRNGISPDVIVSLQNSGIITHCKQVVYYHQPIPFYPQRWCIFKAEERIMALYKYLYPTIIAPTFNKFTNVVVQVPFIKKKFVKRFSLNSENVHVLFPDIEDIDVESIIPSAIDKTKYHVVYPATYFSYKEHRTIVEALFILKEKGSNLLEDIRVHFTLSKDDSLNLVESINEKGLIDNFIFEGRMSHDNLLSLYKASDVLVFPSVIETLGLPLIEAAKFGLPIIAVDLDYAHEVLSSYSGVTYVKPKIYDNWANSIEFQCYNRGKFPPIEMFESSWKNFFDLIK